MAVSELARGARPWFGVRFYFFLTLLRLSDETAETLRGEVRDTFGFGCDALLRQEILWVANY